MLYKFTEIFIMLPTFDLTTPISLIIFHVLVMMFFIIRGEPDRSLAVVSLSLIAFHLFLMSVVNFETIQQNPVLVMFLYALLMASFVVSIPVYLYGAIAIRSKIKGFGIKKTKATN